MKHAFPIFQCSRQTKALQVYQQVKYLVARGRNTCTVTVRTTLLDLWYQLFRYSDDYKFLEEPKVKVSLNDSSIFAFGGDLAGNIGYGSTDFHKLGRQKVLLAKAFAGFGLDTVLCDVDFILLKDPTAYFQRYPAVDILVTSDDAGSSLSQGDDGLESHKTFGSPLNIGE